VTVAPFHVSKFYMVLKNITLSSNIDICPRFLSDINEGTISQTFLPFHERGGKLPFLHDLIRDRLFDRWGYFAKKLEIENVGAQSDAADRVEVIRMSPVLTIPFKLPLVMQIARTHSWYNYKGQNVIVGDPKWKAPPSVGRKPLHFYDIEAQ
jgi:hypothetical protein